MERYYDAHLYLTNWGTHQVMLRLPRTLLSLEAAEQYCIDPYVAAWASGEHLILDLSGEDESGDWAEGAEDSLPVIVGVRAELAAGTCIPYTWPGWRPTAPGNATRTPSATKKTNSNHRSPPAWESSPPHSAPWPTSSASTPTCSPSQPRRARPWPRRKTTPASGAPPADKRPAALALRAWAGTVLGCWSLT